MLITENNQSYHLPRRVHFTLLGSLGKFNIVLLLLALCSGSGLVLASDTQTTNQPSAEVPSLDLDQYRGQVVYVDFWASWCGPCRASFPFLNRMHEQYRDAGLTIIGINVDDKRTDADSFLSKIPANFQIIYDHDGVLARRLGVSAMPHSFLYGRDGELIQQHKGFRKEDPAPLEQAIKTALADALEEAVLEEDVLADEMLKK